MKRLTITFDDAPDFVYHAHNITANEHKVEGCLVFVPDEGYPFNFETWRICSWDIEDIPEQPDILFVALWHENVFGNHDH